MLPSMRAYCSAAGQCSSGLGCSDELTPRCRPTCASDADCISSEACYETRFGERVCVPARCRDSTECLGPGEWCGSIGIGDDRHCRTDCMDSAQCPKDFVCSSITSQVGPPFTCRPTCASDAQCPDGSFCLSEQDHPAFCAVGCNESADCPEAEHCVRCNYPGASACPAAPTTRSAREAARASPASTVHARRQRR